ncbi:hypothetical protein [Nostoc linckia]|uniref:hypothetical protein n=1 Tax=Nostoc linckia TaxID=92942 RepID=UPI00352A7A1B
MANFTQAIEFNPDSAQAYHYRSLSYKKLGNMIQAFDDMEKASSINLISEKLEFQ